MPFVKSLTGGTLVCGPYVIHADRATRFEEVPEILLPLVDREKISISDENPDVLRAEGIVITLPVPAGTGGAQNDGDTDPGGSGDKSPIAPVAPEGSGETDPGGSANTPDPEAGAPPADAPTGEPDTTDKGAVQTAPAPDPFDEDVDADTSAGDAPATAGETVATVDPPTAPAAASDPPAAPAPAPGGGRRRTNT